MATHRLRLNPTCLFILVLLVSINALAQTQLPNTPALNGSKDQLMLPNGWKLSPAGRSLPLGDLPLNMVLSPNKRLMVVTNNGQSTQTLQLIDVVAEKVLDTKEIKKSWYGLRFSGNGRYVYASGGNDNIIWKYDVSHQKIALADSFILGKRWPERISPTGIDIDERRQLMYVVTKENNSLYIVDLQSKTVKQQIPLTDKAYTCLLSPDKQTLFISSWGDDRLHIFNTVSNSITSTIDIGDNPNEMLLSKNGQYLYVATANDNGVSVYDIKNKKVLEILNAALFSDSPAGSTTNGLALSADGKSLFIANADNNCLAVFDVSVPGKSKSKGFIPVGWYPTNVKVAGKKIMVANGKGFTSFANPDGPNPASRNEEVVYQKGEAPKAKKVQYIAGLLQGSLSMIDMPDEAKLKNYSAQVYSNTPYNKKVENDAEGEKDNPIPTKVGQPSPIKHVFYIIKENRTYDQVLGDVKGGNGDTSLVLFGENITPNQHALVKEFALLDNFYVNAEVSADGHNWTMAAYANDYVEKTWPTSYGGRGGTYDYEGQKKIAWPKKGFIWNHCKAAGISYRTYGEFAGAKADIPVLENHFCPYYPGWNLRIRDTVRYYRWEREFDSLVAQNALPQFMSVRMGNDHTEGLSIGRPTPFAHAADNDLAVGMFVEHLSKSPVWKESVVFIVEDDAQNGPDHVDAHRSTVYVAGGLVKRHYVDHNMYTTASVLRTIGLIIGMPPMSQYDAAAMPLYRCFTSQADLTPFKALPARVNLDDKNEKRTASAIKSAKFDFSREDNIPDLEFSEVIWKAIKGENSIMPAPRKSAFVVASKQAKDDDDDD